MTIQDKTRNSLLASLLLIPIFAALAVPSPAEAQVNIMAVGDSITEGINGTTSYRSPLVDGLSLSGCNYLMVGSRTENLTQTNFSSPHEGYSGHRVDFFVNASGGNPSNPGIVSMMNSQNPDVLLVHLGSNDMFGAQTISSTVTELDQLVTQVWNINAEAEIFVANVIPWYGTAQQNPNISADIDSLGTAIENWISNESDTRLHLVDVRSGFTQSLMQNDLIHPNAQGDDHIADAFLSAISQTNVCPDTTPPDTFISNPATAGATLPGTYTYTGTATDVGGVGFDRVRIAIEDNNYTNGSDRWFNFATGVFGPYSESIATLTNVTSTTANWSFTATLPTGDYTVYALAVDNAGNQNYFNTGVWPTNRQYNVLADSQSPTTSIDTSLSNNGVIPAGNYNFSGSATDAGGSGFRFVRFAIRSRSLSQWYNFSNNSFSGAVGNGATSANLTNTSNNATDWNYDVLLSAGEYTLAVRTFDNAGNASPWTLRKFSVQSADNLDPATSILTPAATNNILSPGNYNFSGTASDTGGSGFKFVRVAIRSRSSGTFDQWYNFNNSSFSGAAGNGAVSASLSSTSATSTNWDLNASLPLGNYTLYVRTFDNADNTSSWIQRPFAIRVSDTLDPTTSILTPAATDNILSPGNYNFSGTASDTGGSGFKFVRVAIRSRSSGTFDQWYNFNNSSFSGATGNGAVSASLSNTLATSTDWGLDASLPLGKYTLYVRTFDNANNTSSWIQRPFAVR